MLQIKDTLISLDIIEQNFCCNLSKCKGLCCVEGESGAPLEKEEIMELENALPRIWDKLSDEAKSIIEKQGVAYIDEEGELVTSIVNRKDCVFAFHDEKGICKCALEQAWREKKISFMKPVSCHLYPVRTKRYNTYTAVNYQEWTICSSAVQTGNQAGIPVYIFLKEPLIRKFGQEWYDELCIAANLLAENNERPKE